MSDWTTKYTQWALPLGGHVAALTLLVSGLWATHHHWKGQFSGYGLAAEYYESTDFKGATFDSAIEHRIEFSKNRASQFKRPLSVRWTGTIVLPRTGRYVFATESDDGSWMHLDGKLVLDNGGAHELRRVETVLQLTEGPHAIELRYVNFGGDGTLRWFWTPPGRMGLLEDVPATLLFSAGASSKHLPRAYAIPPRDFLAIGLYVALVCCYVVFIFRRRLLDWGLSIGQRPARRNALLIFLALVAFALILRLYGLSDAGQTWDEDVYWAAARNYIQNLLHGRFDAVYWMWNREHPALSKWLYGPATLISEHFGPARAVSAMLGALTCGFVFLAGRDFFGLWAGIYGGLFACLMPHLIAHSKIIGLESPTGLFFTLSFWLFYRGCCRNGNNGYHLAAGLFAGAALATRLTNLSLLLGLAWLYWLLFGPIIRKDKTFPVPITLGLAPLVALGFFFGIWPYLWTNPIQHVGTFLSVRGAETAPELFFGAEITPPWYYFPAYFGATTPAGLLLAMSLVVPFGLGVSGNTIGRKKIGLYASLIWFLTPFLMSFSPVIQDGVRYIYPSLIAACVLGGAGMAWLGAILSRWIPGAFGGLSVAILGYACLAALPMHPYYLDYYNELVGGPERVQTKRLFEMAWWGEGLQEAINYIHRDAPHGASVHVMANPRHVIRFRPDINSGQGMSADYILYNQLFNGPIKAPSHRIVYVVRARNAPLVWVYKRNDLPSVGIKNTPQI